MARKIKADDQRSSGRQAVTATREYDAFGNVMSPTGSWAGPFGYAGKFGYQSPSIPGVSTPDEGITLMGHRYYDSSTSRFLTRDPIFDGRNWYSYGGGEGNPLTMADPTGLREMPAGSITNHLPEGYTVIAQSDIHDPRLPKIKFGPGLTYEGQNNGVDYVSVAPGVTTPGWWGLNKLTGNYIDVDYVFVFDPNGVLIGVWKIGPGKHVVELAGNGKVTVRPSSRISAALDMMGWGDRLPMAHGPLLLSPDRPTHPKSEYRYGWLVNNLPEHLRR